MAVIGKALSLFKYLFGEADCRGHDEDCRMRPVLTGYQDLSLELRACVLKAYCVPGRHYLMLPKQVYLISV